MSYEPENYGPEPSSAPRAAFGPGVFLIVVAVANLLGGLGGIGMAIMFAAIPNEMFEKALEQQNPQQRKALEEQGMGPQQLRNIYIYGGGITGVVGLISGAIMLLGGIQMCRGRSYGLAVLASVLALLTGCCLLGQAAGIWALIVLVNPEVKAAFR
jgi:hypothetical protein